jgi:hypothetical protein
MSFHKTYCLWLVLSAFCVAQGNEPQDDDLLLFESESKAEHKFRLEWRGHLAQKFLKTENHNYLHDNSKKGTFDLNEFALNASGDITEDLHLNSQLIARNALKDSIIDIDFANVSYDFRTDSSIMVGKNKMPLGWFNQSLDSAHANPFITPPVGVYSPGFHDTIVSAWGLGYYTTHHLDKGHFLNFELVLGTTSVNSDSDYLKESRYQITQSTINALKALLAGTTTTVDRVELVDYDVNVEQRLAAQFRWNTPYGLKLGYSLGYDQVGINYQSHIYTTTSQPIAPGVTLPISATTITNFEEEVEIYPNHIFSLEYIINPQLRFTAEYQVISMRYTSVSSTSRSHFDLTDRGYYLMLNYRPMEKIGLNYYFSQLDAETLQLKGHREIDEHAITLQYDFSSNWLVRFEAHFIDGPAPFLFMNPNGVNGSTEVYMLQAAYIFGN